jgi:Xaa-Pro aminopeptidase
VNIAGTISRIHRQDIVDAALPSARSDATPIAGAAAILVNMRAVLCFLLIAGSTAVAADGPSGATISRDEYRARRAALRQSIDGMLVLFAPNEPQDMHQSFFQEYNFLYLSGWREPGAAMILTAKEEILLLPPRDPKSEIFTGRKVGPEDRNARELTGFDKVLPFSALQTQFLRLLENTNRIYTLTSDPQAQKLQTLAPFHEAGSAESLIGRFRMKKSPAEIELISKATDATLAAHRAAWKRMKPGLREYEIAATMTNVYFEMGCERSAYAPIVGSGPNSVILHYSANRRRMDSGEVVVMDVGAECSDYASDVTRTLPVNGKFTARQREIYDIVLGSQKAAIAAVKPGAKVRGDGGLYRIAYDYINSHGQDLHGEPLGKYFTHGLSHHVGLEVHDESDIDTPLTAGMVITIEPGIYIPDENIGIRIEDIVLVTETGAKVLSAALPRDAGEIERLIGK